MKQALFYEKLNGDVQCNLCPRNCKISQNNRGICDVRENKNGELFSLVYGKIASMNVDPIEKKPLFHFAPGTNCLSIATVGCNLKCSFCQNWEISHPKEIVGKELSPEEIIEFNNKYNSPGIAYTYTEPTVFYEYALDIMELAKKQGLYNIWVSNGFINIEPIKKIAKYLDAINVDMKGDIEFYQKLCGVPNEDPIRESLIEYKKQNVWIEITNLIIPGYNDKPEQIENLVNWIKENLGVDTPIHFSRFYPQYQLTNVRPTPIEILEKAVEIAKKHLNYVYLGNVHGNKHENTYCPKCNSLVIERFGLEIKKFSLNCNKCGEHVIIKGKEHIPKNLLNQ